MNDRSTHNLPLYCCYSRAHSRLFEKYFTATLPPSFTLKSYFLDMDGSGDFMTADFLRCIQQKVNLIRESIEVHAGEWIVWSDVDIRFFGDPVGFLIELTTSQTHDIWFQREARSIPDVNSGFMLISCTERTGLFFNEVADRLRSHPGLNEQTVINQMLQTSPGIEWGYLPGRFYARTQGWPPPRDLLLYHANFTVGANSIQQKELQFAEINRVVRYGWPARLWSCLKRVPREISRRGSKTMPEAAQEVRLKILHSMYLPWQYLLRYTKYK